MIAATCCRCRRELNEKGGVLLRPPYQEGQIDGLLGDWVVKHHVCASCMAAILEWLKQPSTPRTVRCTCGAELIGCSQCGAGEPVGHIVCPVAERQANRPEIVGYHYCSLHFFGGMIPASKPAEVKSESSPTKVTDWATVEASHALAEVVSRLSPDEHQVGLGSLDALAAQFRAVFDRGRAQLAALLKETRPFLKRARDHWPETSSPQSFIAQVDDLEWRIDTALLQPTAPPIHGPTTTHVLFEGHPLCGFMAGSVPSGWPDGHNWVSIVEVIEREPGVLSIPTNETCTPCDRCLSFVSASSLIRNRA